MNTNSLYSKSSCSRRLRGVAITLVSTALISLPTSAVLADTAGNDDIAKYEVEKQVSANEAKRLARSHLNEQGFSTRVGPGPGAARLKSITRDAGTWIVTARVSNGGTVLNKQRILYIDAQTGVVSDVAPSSSPSQVAAE